MPCQFNLCFTDIIPQLVAAKVEGPKNNYVCSVETGNHNLVSTKPSNMINRLLCAQCCCSQLTTVG